ncbi:hypothetical protein IHE44_0007911 [Lamprotornis superbus]|uniref:V-SNARE coiled-coil homology domain-containing protein n=1 Tax=Lamprotornis superbus TaxID=245042 RepID=A0A835TUW3_9PASS|nr:hypothetical protein IHE44_0007911 [Lamprotornis superbus]
MCQPMSLEVQIWLRAIAGFSKLNTKVNVDKVLERDQKLSELDDRADALQAGASQFETSAAKLKRKYWWKNCKMWAILIAVVVIIIIIIIGNLESDFMIYKKKVQLEVPLRNFFSLCTPNLLSSQPIYCCLKQNYFDYRGVN